MKNEMTYLLFGRVVAYLSSAWKYHFGSGFRMLAVIPVSVFCDLYVL